MFTAEKLQDKINKHQMGIFAHVDKLHGNLQQKLRERICCKICGFVVIVGSVIAAALIISLAIHKLVPIPIEERCGLRCALRDAEWADFSEMQLDALGLQLPAAVFDELSSIYVERRRELAASFHEKGEVRRLKDAHRRLSQGMKDLTIKFNQVNKMEDTKEKAELLRQIVRESGHVQDLSSAISRGASWDVAKTLHAVTEDTLQCANTLQHIGVDSCSEDPGILPAFLRAVGVGPHGPSKSSLPVSPPYSPTWPLDTQYPGLRTLNADHGVHVIDGFLSPAECEQLIKSASMVHVKNRSRISHGSFAETRTLSATRARSYDRNPKWLSSGMPGALIQLDMKVEQDCRPLGDSSAEGWVQVLGPLFKAKGQDLEKCEKAGFGDTELHDEACPHSREITSSVTSKLEHLLQAGRSHLQPLQLEKYGTGDFDFDHFDHDIEMGSKSTAHLVTVMVYLNSVKGGGTYFPNIDLRVEPTPGQALIFPTLSMNLTLRMASLHAEEEVKQGDKWILSTSLFLGQRTDLPQTC